MKATARAARSGRREQAPRGRFSRSLAGLAVLVALVASGCGRTTVGHERDLVVPGGAADQPSSRPTPDQESRGLRITSTRIAIVTHGQASDPIWGVVRRGAEDAGRANNVAVSYDAPDTFDIQRMKSLLQDAIDRRPDGIVVSLPDARTLGPTIKEAERVGIPVVTINSGSDAFRSLGVIAHVGQPEFQAGEEVGERMYKAGATTVLCVNHEPGNQGLADRCRGLLAGLRKHGGSSRELDIDPQNADKAQAQIAQELESGAADGIVTLGPTGAAPALDALRASGFDGTVKLATFDLSSVVLDAIKDGRILFAVDQQPYLEGYLPIVLLAERARHGIFPAPGGLIPTGPRFVDKSNVDETIRQSRDGVR
jgi:simple sugar transport system substrate-binding protein